MAGTFGPDAMDFLEILVVAPGIAGPGPDGPVCTAGKAGSVADLSYLL